jgi:hypothetical protein
MTGPTLPLNLNSNLARLGKQHFQAAKVETTHEEEMPCFILSKKKGCGCFMDETMSLNVVTRSYCTRKTTLRRNFRLRSIYAIADKRMTVCISDTPQGIELELENRVLNMEEKMSGTMHLAERTATLIGLIDRRRVPERSGAIYLRGETHNSV